MARGGKSGYRRKTRNKVRSENKGSDESDEDYMVAEDDEFFESEEYCSSFAEDESDESLGELEEEDLEEEWVEKKVKKVARPKGRKSNQGSKKNRVVRPRKRKVAYNDDDEEEEEDDDDNEDEDYDYDVSNERKRNKLSHKEDEVDDGDFWYRPEDNLSNRKSRKNSRASCTDISRDGNFEKPRKKNKVSYREENEDEDDDVDHDDDFDDDDDDDEEFTPDEIDGLDDEEELPVSKKNNISRQRTPEARIAKGQRRKRNSIYNTSKRTKKKKPAKKKDLRRNNRSNIAKDLKDNKRISSKKKKGTDPSTGRRSRKSNSDSDFVSSGSSDYEYTVSEEEREQIREASEICKRLNSNSRSSSSLKTIKEEERVYPQRKRPVRKGKEKEADVKIEVVAKQVCGICLSEEGKRTIRGILNCCSHYFCFACIMEWSKVESRCPLCKQRFVTISRPARADGGHDLRDAVISVPERDQVYQPSEEELRGYLDPYENVLCTECNLGGDDALMLLCDLCDSPAHTYCVGLGHEVPDGNWYCDGCRPSAPAPVTSQASNPTPDCGASNHAPVGSPPAASTVRETFDLNEMYVPETPLTQVTVPSPSPRPSIGDSQPLSPASGSLANTLLERRRIQQHIRQVLHSRQTEIRDNGAQQSNISLFGSQIARNVMMAQEHALMPVRLAPQSVYQQGRIPDYGTPSLYSRELLSPRLNSLREQALLNQASTSTDFSFAGMQHRDLGGTSANFGGAFVHQQLHPCNGRSQTGAEASSLPYQFREATVPSRTLQGQLHTPF